MTFYNRKGILYVSIAGKRISTKLEYSKDNIKLYQSYTKNEEFFKKFSVRKKDKTILDFCEEVLIEKEKRLQPTTMLSYNSLYYTKIIPYFNKKYPQDITPLFLKEYYSTFSSKSALTTCIAILKPAFENAIIEEYIKTSPFIVSYPTIKSNYEMNPFNLEEIKLILDTATGWFKNFIGVAFFTGARTGEVLALEWKDINFQESTIHINKTRTAGFTKKPKTKSSVRVINMLSQCEYFLKEQRKITGLCKKVFYREPGKDFYSSNALSRTWKRLLGECNLEYRSIYQTRHSFASNMISNGEDPFWVAQTLGHKSMNVTLEKYSKYIKHEKSKKTTFLDNSDDIIFNTKIAH